MTLHNSFAVVHCCLTNNVVAIDLLSIQDKKKLFIDPRNLRK